MSQTSRKSQRLSHSLTKPLLIVLSGPSGAGKDAVLTGLKESGYPLGYITTVTTRPQRDNERDNIDYHFVSAEMFQQMIKSKQLLEWANVYGNMYGVPRQPVKQALDSGQDVMVKVDIQGAATIKRILPQSALIFLTPLATEDLSLRLQHRNTETASNLSLRLKTAEEEIKQLPIFDYVVVNQQGKIDSAVSHIKAIITAEKCRVNPREVTL